MDYGSPYRECRDDVETLPFMGGFGFRSYIYNSSTVRAGFCPSTVPDLYEV